ncbi:ankyrin repeat domain-containing protein SOWAHB [Gastrophryne carolinensis]
MASQLSQEEVLDFLCQGGGRVTNAALLGHFKLFLRDAQAPGEQLLKRRERFKRYVNSVAVVRAEGGVKYVVLRSRYRDLLGEELCPEEQVGDGGGAMPLQGNGQVGGGAMPLQGNGQDGGGAMPPRSNGQARHHHDPGQATSLIIPHCSRNVNGTLDERICPPALYAQDPLHQPACQLSSPVSAHQLNSNAYPHDTPSLDSNTLSQEPHNMITSPTRTSSLAINMPPARTCESAFVTSIPLMQDLCQNTSTTGPCSDGSVFLANTSGSPFASIASSKNMSPSDTKNPSHCSASISSSDIASLPTKSSFISSRTPGPHINASLPIQTSSASNGSPPSSKTSSPSNAPMNYTSKSPGLQSNASLPITKTSSPSNVSTSSSKTSSPSIASMNYSSKSPGLQSNAPIPLTKIPSSPRNASMPFSKTSEPPSNTGSPFTNHYSPANSHSEVYCMESPCCSSKGSSLLESPFSGVDQSQRLLSKGEGIIEYTNPAFVNVTSRDLDRQRHGCTACTEPQTSHFHLNCSFHQGVHLGQDLSNCIEEQQGYRALTAFSHSPQYNECTAPSPIHLAPHESGFSSDVLLTEDPHTSPSPPLPHNDMHGMWMYEMPVFKSIRCQLSLQDMEDFVDQESCGSEDSDSGEGGDCDTEHRDDDDPSSDSNNEKYVQFLEKKCEDTRRCPPNRKFSNIIEQYSKLQSGDLLGAKDTLVEGVGSEPTIDPDIINSPYVVKSFLTDQAPVMFELARQPPKHRMSSRFRELMSSSDDELIDRDYKKRRRPSRTRRPSNILVPPQPDVDMLLTVKSVSCNQFIVNNLVDQKASQAQHAPNVSTYPLLKKSAHFKQSSVPLDAMEHDWIVKSASGSWLQVYGLFMEDPQLALRKDFISGYTALHWFAKHGAVEMFQKFVNGAKKAGIELDFNIKSNGGYTPLHVAAIHGHHKVAAMLVERLRANVKLRDNSGKRAWQYLSCNTTGEVWQLLGAPKGKTIFASRALNAPYNLNAQAKSSHISRKTSLAAFLKPQHQKWKEKHQPILREREIYSD